jgi:hypothetical protein
VNVPSSAVLEVKKKEETINALWNAGMWLHAFFFLLIHIVLLFKPNT